MDISKGCGMWYGFCFIWYEVCGMKYIKSTDIKIYCIVIVTNSTV